MKKLSEIKIGDTFKGNDGVERILLDLFSDVAFTITKDVVCYLKFSEFDNNYSNSIIHKMLSEKVEELKETFGADNVFKTRADLLSLNGYDTCGSIESEYRLMTFDEARRYMPILRKYQIQEIWWLATPQYTNNKCGFVDEIEIAIKALEKQIPKKPAEKQVIGVSATGYKYKGQCPRCFMSVQQDENNYCPNCGQRIDWSESNG